MKSEADRFGMSVALATPFAENSSVNHQELVLHARWCLEHGCDSVTLFGTTGEGPSLTSQERMEGLAVALEAGIMPEQIVLGVIPTTISEAVEETRTALVQNTKAVLLAPPFYFNGPSEDGVFLWYSAVLDALGSDARDIILYNIPSLTQVPISVELVSRLRKKYGRIIRGVKDSSCDWSITKPLVQTHGDIDILVGDERDLAPAVRIGGSGAIGGLANLFPAQVRDLVEGRDNKFITDLVELVVSEPVVSSIKAIIAHQKSDDSWSRPRLPLLGLTVQKQTKFFEKLVYLQQQHGVSLK
ncbi:MAG: dihydrodipicolinate synthase family protein [Hyphomicrobiales bacterium]